MKLFINQVTFVTLHPLNKGVELYSHIFRDMDVYLDFNLLSDASAQRLITNE